MFWFSTDSFYKNFELIFFDKNGFVVFDVSTNLRYLNVFSTLCCIFGNFYIV